MQSTIIEGIRAMRSDRRSKDDSDKALLRAAQIDLVRLQRHVIETGQKVLVLFEGRDAAGKDGTIKRVSQHMSPRDTRIVALAPPSDRDRRSWYFQRHVAHFPVAGEIALFNRSWYNRAGVERVMGYCTKKEYEQFLETVPMFETLLTHCGVKLVKYYLDISKAEQRRRLKDRRDDPLTQWKTSPVDDQAVKLWKAYSKARDEMLLSTHTDAAPWRIVRADDKPKARLNVIRDLLTHFDFGGQARQTEPPDDEIVFKFHGDALRNGQIAR